MKYVVILTTLVTVFLLGLSVYSYHMGWCELKDTVSAFIAGIVYFPILLLMWWEAKEMDKN